MRPWRNWIAHRSSEPRVEGSNPSGRTHFTVRSLRTLVGRIVLGYDCTGSNQPKTVVRIVLCTTDFQSVGQTYHRLPVRRPDVPPTSSPSAQTYDGLPVRHRARNPVLHLANIKRRACAQPRSSRPYRTPSFTQRTLPQKRNGASRPMPYLANVHRTARAQSASNFMLGILLPIRPQS